jgi:Flp pilus assembly protein TadG
VEPLALAERGIRGDAMRTPICWPRRHIGQTAEGPAGNGDRTKVKRAQSLVEFALAFPMLMLILLGTIDIGRIFFDYIDLRNATNEGANYGARNPTDLGGITAAVTYSGVPAGTIVSAATSGDCDTLNGNGTITVQASSVFTPITSSFFASFGLGPWNVSSSTTMRCLT